MKGLILMVVVSKILKIFLKAILVLFILFIIDIFCIFTINRPLFAYKVNNENLYKGIFYNVYNCDEYSKPQIKMKGSKFSCSFNNKNLKEIKEIVDKSKTVEDFACAQALEKFYEDDTYIYYWSCIKNSYIIVKYNNGQEEYVSDALNNGDITINDLDLYNIKYIKQEK